MQIGNPALRSFIVFSGSLSLPDVFVNRLQNLSAIQEGVDCVETAHEVVDGVGQAFGVHGDDGELVVGPTVAWRHHLRSLVPRLRFGEVTAVT